MANGRPGSVRIEYINTDLLLQSENDLSDLVSYFNGADCFDLYVSEDRKSAGFESNLTAENPAPAQTIAALLDAVDRLDGALLAAWRACEVREFDIGFNCGQDPYSTHDRLPPDLLKRVADAGITLVITLYAVRVADTTSTPT